MPIHSININTKHPPVMNHSIALNDNNIYTTAITNTMKHPNRTTSATAKTNASNLLNLITLFPPQIFHVLL